MALKTASLRLKIAVGFSLLATICHAIGFATDYWWKGQFGHGGLWEECHLGVCGHRKTENSFLAVRAMATIGIICLGAVLLMSILYLFIERMRRRGIRTFLILGSLLAAVAIGIAVTVYGVIYIKDSGTGHFSFALVIIGGIFALLATIMYAIDRIRV